VQHTKIFAIDFPHALERLEIKHATDCHQNDAAQHCTAQTKASSERASNKKEEMVTDRHLAGSRTVMS
jgi:hypothetical protein